MGNTKTRMGNSKPKSRIAERHQIVSYTPPQPVLPDPVQPSGTVQPPEGVQPSDPGQEHNKKKKQKNDHKNKEKKKEKKK